MAAAGAVRPAQQLLRATAWLAAAALVAGNKFVELVFNNSLPGRDSGVFLTIAQGILAGRIPYRDFWDHKPPGIYYIDALILRLLPAWPSSLHMVELAVALLALVVFYRLLRSFASPAWASFGVVLFAFFSTHPYTNEGGNFTETYALLPTILAWALLVNAGEGASRWRFVAAGTALGIAALIRPQAAVHLAPVAGMALLGPLAWRQGGPRPGLPSGLAAVAAAALGFAAPVAVVVAYFAAQAALPELWAQVIEYNRVYASTVPPGAGFASLVNALRAFPAHPLLLAGALVAAAVGLGAALRRGRQRRPAAVEQARPLADAAWIAAWLLLECAALALGGRYYNHYFLVIVPPALALTVWGLAQAAAAGAGERGRPAPVPALTLAAGFAAAAAFLWLRDVRPLQAQFLPLVRVERVAGDAAAPLPDIAAVPPGEAYTVLRAGGLRLAVVRQPPSAEERVGFWLRQNTPSGAAIEVWGANAGLYFVSGRRPASRYLYNFPLIGRVGDTFAPSPELPALQEAYLAHLAAVGPAAIVVASDRLDPSGGDRLDRLPGLARLIEARYRLAHEDEGYRVYLLR